MEKCILPYGRAPQILSVLAKHGPLTMMGLQKMITPRIDRRRLRDAVQRLLKKRILYVRSGVDKVNYYQIKRHPNAWKKAADIFNCEPELFELPHFFRINAFDSESCAIWAEKFKHLFADAFVYRHFEIPACSSNFFPSELLPDIMIHWAPGLQSLPTTIVVLVENDYRSNKKFTDKIKHYSSLSFIDAIFLIVADWHFDEKMDIAVRCPNMKKAIRSSNVGPYYLGATIFEIAISQPVPALVNSEHTAISALNWMRVLRKTKAVLTTPDKIQTSGTPLLKVGGNQ